MSQTEIASRYKWFCTGDELFPEMLAAIDGAHTSICFEIYIFRASPLGEQFREALTRAVKRGVRVRTLVDALGSVELPAKFWEPLQQAGGEVKWFNPFALKQFWMRNHRKLLVCDDCLAFVGGFNVAPEYEGDGIARGWRDLGMRIEGPLVPQLTLSFEEMFARADFRHKSFPRLRKSLAKKTVLQKEGELLFSGPGRGRSPIQRALLADLRRATQVKIIMAYFLPSWRLRHALTRVMKRGGNVQLILPGKSDVLLSQLAGRSLYRRFLKAGVEIFEYQPQILHAKLIVVDNMVYAGSANLDPRSLQINYELMIRFENGGLVEQARGIFADHLKNCVRIEAAQWRASRTIWRRIKHRLARWLLMNVDPWMARWQWRWMPK